MQTIDFCASLGNANCYKMVATFGVQCGHVGISGVTTQWMLLMYVRAQGRCGWQNRAYQVGRLRRKN